MKKALLSFGSLVCLFTWATPVLSQQDKGSWGDPKSITAIVAVLVALLSLGFAVLQFHLNRKDQQRAKIKEQLLGALQWFGKGIQERSIGIAVITAHWDDAPDLRKIWVSVLVSQALQILTRSEKQTDQTNSDNLNQIMDLLWRENLDRDRRQALHEALSRANCIDNSGNEKKKSNTGLFVEEQKLQKWKTHFQP
jgi:hypothetical protein